MHGPKKSKHAGGHQKPMTDKQKRRASRRKAGPLRPVASGVGVESIAYGADGSVSFVGADGSERVVEPARGRKP
jgi:hypothetical protein